MMNLKTLALGAAILGAGMIPASPAFADWHDHGGYYGGGGYDRDGGDWHDHGGWDGHRHCYGYGSYGTAYGYYPPPPAYYEPPPPPVYYAPPPVYYAPPGIVITPGGIGFTP